MITIPTNADTVEQVADELGVSVTAGDGQLVTVVITEGGVQLRLVSERSTFTPDEAVLLYTSRLRHITSNPDVLRLIGEIEGEIAHASNSQNSSGRASGQVPPSTKPSDVVSRGLSCARPEVPFVAAHGVLAQSLCAAHDITDQRHEAQDAPCGPCWRQADLLLNSGAIQTPAKFAAALADDQESIEVVAAGMVASPSHATREQARRGLRALAKRSVS